MGQALLLLSFSSYISHSSRLGEPTFSSFLFLFTSSAWALAVFASLTLLLRSWGGSFSSFKWAFLTLSLGFFGESPTTRLFATYPTPPLPTLFNGVLFIHPVLLYLAWSFALILLAQHLLTAEAPRLYAPAFRAGLWPGLACLVLALLLGASWAQQELNWGGWWSWDLVEAGTLLIGLVFLLTTHNRSALFPTPSLMVFLGFGLGFFFIGLRYGLFNSVHAFVGSAQTDYKTQAGLYGLSALLGLRYGRPASRHTGLLLLTSLLLGLSLGFMGDFFAKFYKLPWYWPLGRLLTLTYLLWAVSWPSSTPQFWLVGLAPYFSPWVTPKWTWRVKGKIVHQLFLLSWSGVLLTKFALPAFVFFPDLGALSWTSHRTYLLLTQEISELLPVSSYTGSAVTTQSPQSWGYPVLPLTLAAPSPLTYLGWGVNFQVLWLLQTTTSLTVVLGLASAGAWLLLKKPLR